MAGSVAEGESNELSEKTSVFGLRSWVLIGIGIGVFVVLVLFFLSIWLSFRKRSRKKRGSPTIPSVSKEIPEVQSDHHYLYRPQPLFKPQPQYRPQPQPQPQPQYPPQPPPPPPLLQQAPHSESSGEKKEVASHFGGNPARHHGGGVCQIGTEDGPNLPPPPPPRLPDAAPPPLVVVGGGGVPEVSHLGWGHWYTLRDLETATDGFLDDNVLGQGSYGIVYRGKMPDYTLIAVKNLLNNRGQAEKEFKVEVEAIGRVRHKNLVRLLGYCAEGSHRMLVYEYVENGNLSQWLHGSLAESNPIPWDARIKIVLGTAKGLAYLHEGLEPKVVHRDVKSSNILLDRHWNAKLSDFGLAKLLGSGRSHVATRVMGTFGYVAPEYANTGLLTERNDVYSFGVLLMEVITGRDPVDYARPSGEINLVDWLKMMVGSRRSDEVADPRLEVKPSSRALKRALLVALRCVDPDAQKRPKMGHVVHMLESEDDPFQNDRRFSRHALGSRDNPSGRGISKANTTQNVVVEKEEDNTQFGNKSRWKRYEA